MLLDLFLGFLNVGCFSFGGAYSAIPLIRDVVLSRGWLSEEALTGMIAVSESTPGPLMVNLATYVGSSQAGLAGALTATAAVVLPSFVLILLISAVMGKLVKNRYVQAALKGMKPAIAGIILATGLVLTLRQVLPAEGCLNERALAVLLLLIAAQAAFQRFRKKKLSPICLILLSAVLGAVIL